jgi:hypothetical protein
MKVLLLDLWNYDPNRATDIQDFKSGYHIPETMNAQIRTISVAFLFCTLTCGRSAGTELVMIIEKNRVVLAADSLVTDDPLHQSMRRCKIHQSGTDNYFYAISGVTFDREIAFDADTFFLKRRRNLDGAQSLDAIGAAFLPLLQKELSLIQKETPSRYDAVVRGGNMESLFVVQTIGHHAVGYVKDFKIVNGRVVPSPARNCLGTHVLVLGERCTSMSSMKTLLPFLAKNPIQRDDDTVTRVSKIMDAAVSANPNEVGPPVAILDIEPGGPQWLEKGLCEDIRKPSKVKKAPKAKP